MKINIILKYPELFILLQKIYSTSKFENYNIKIDPISEQKNYSTSKFKNYNIEIDPTPNDNYPNLFNYDSNRKILIDYVDEKKKPYTASYIYTVDKDGSIYFALARKVPDNARIRISGPNTGAAGTELEYYGKWGSIGGGVSKKNINYLFEAVNEIKNEAGLNFLKNTNDVFVNLNLLQDRENKFKNTLNKLILRDYKYLPNLDGGNINIKGCLFLFEMKSETFFEYFPKYPETKGGAVLVQSSFGEIDLVTSMNADTMFEQQQNSILYEKNNLIISYAVDSFNTFVIPYFQKKGIEFSFYDKENNKKVDKIKRIIDKDPLADPYKKKYREVPGRNYKDES